MATVREVSKAARIRAQRQAAQAPKKRRGVPRPPGASTSRGWLYAGVAGAAGLIALILVLASVLSSSSGTKASPETVSISSAAATNTLLAGIPQNGATLGNPKAPVTMYEFADLQCPGCDQYMKQAFPDIVRTYVRTGKVKVIWNGISFIGPDSEKALRFVNAAGQQNKLWHVAELLYRNQGEENSGWVTNAMLRSVATAVPGLDPDTVESAVNSSAVNRQMADASNRYSTFGFTGTPSFAIGPTGGTAEAFSPSSYSVGAFAPTFDKIIEQQSKQ
jgi:protein-disulfide isomerase